MNSSDLKKLFFLFFYSLCIQWCCRERFKVCTGVLMGHSCRLSELGVIAYITSCSKTGVADLIRALTAHLECTFAYNPFFCRKLKICKLCPVTQITHSDFFFFFHHRWKKNNCDVVLHFIVQFTYIKKRMSWSGELEKKNCKQKLIFFFFFNYHMVVVAVWG